METVGNNNSDKFTIPPCKYRELQDPVKMQEFYASFDELPEDSPEMEAAMGTPICDRPSCLLNVRIMVARIVAPFMTDTVEDIRYATPPDCNLRREVDPSKDH